MHTSSLPASEKAGKQESPTTRYDKRDQNPVSLPRAAPSHGTMRPSKNKVGPGMGGRSQHPAATAGQTHTEGAANRSEPRGDSCCALGTRRSALRQDTATDPPAHPITNVKTSTALTEITSSLQGQRRLPLPFPFETLLSLPELEVRLSISSIPHPKGLHVPGRMC